jgi:hypothetical protein
VAAQLAAEVIWHVTHGPIIDPRSDREPDCYTTETVQLLTRYLTA